MTPRGPCSWLELGFQALKVNCSHTASALRTCAPSVLRGTDRQTGPRKLGAGWARLDPSLAQGWPCSSLLDGLLDQVSPRRARSTPAASEAPRADPKRHPTPPPTPWPHPTSPASRKKPTRRSALAQSSPSKQGWKQLKTPENSGVAFGKLQAEGGGRQGMLRGCDPPPRGHPPGESLAPPTPTLMSMGGRGRGASKAEERAVGAQRHPF